jgi:hypothetical protein
MGRNRWIQIALLIAGLILVSTEAYSATRKTVKHGQSTRDIINGQTATTGAISTPAGAAAFFGAEYTDSHSAGNRFTSGPPRTGVAILPGQTAQTGVISTPYGPGAYYSAEKMGVKITPAVIVGKDKIASKALGALRGGVATAATVAATAAVVWAIEQIPGASFDPLTGEPVKTNAPEIVTTGTFWYSSRGGSEYRASSAIQACRRGQSGTYNVYKNGTTQPLGASDTAAGCHGSFGFLETIYAGTFNCPHGVNPSTYTCYPTAQPFPPAEPFSAADDQAFLAALTSVQNSEWLRDLIKASCNGSNNPDGCYDSLVERRQLMGPALQLGPKISSTTTTTKPDGTTSTSTTTVQNSYSYTYGDNYYDYSTTTRTEVTTDGETTVTETADNQPEGEEPAEEPSEEEFQGDFQDSEFPEVEPFYEQKYPDGLEGVWQSRRAEIDASAFVSFLQSFIPNFSGSCPAYGLSFDLGFANYGSHGFDLGCYVFEFIGVIFMVTALFTARALIFGG